MVPDAFVIALVAIGVALAVLSCLGVALMRDVFDQLHYLSPLSLAAAFLVAAVGVREGFSLIANKAMLLAAFMLFSSPVLVHVTARAIHQARRREQEDE